MAILYRMGTGNGSGGDLKPFIVNFTCDSGFVGKTITMEFQGTPHAGETVDNVSGTVVLDSTDGKGKLTLYPMHDGLWKYYVTSDVSVYREGTIILEKWGNYPVELKDIPNGTTVTPTDDVQTWLNCANIWDKSHTTVTEVIADKTTLNALVQNENANDYLVRSTTFSTKLCENNTNNEAIYYLGLYDSCADKLLADEHWRNAICSADVLLADGQTHLFEKVLNVKVPTMTDNTSPYGECIRSSAFAGLEAYNAFDNNDSTKWHSDNIANGYIGYKFTNPVCVRKVKFLTEVQNAVYLKTYKVQASKNQASKDNDEWITLYEGTVENVRPKVEYAEFENNENYLFYRLGECTSYDQNYIIIHTLQFYGREEN